MSLRISRMKLAEAGGMSASKLQRMTETYPRIKEWLGGEGEPAKYPVSAIILIQGLAKKSDDRRFEPAQLDTLLSVHTPGEVAAMVLADSAPPVNDAESTGSPVSDKPIENPSVDTVKSTGERPLENPPAIPDALLDMQQEQLQAMRDLTAVLERSNALASEERLLSLREASEMLGKKRLSKARLSEAVAPVEVFGSLVWRRSDIILYIATRTPSPVTGGKNGRGDKK